MSSGGSGNSNGGSSGGGAGGDNGGDDGNNDGKSQVTLSEDLVIELYSIMYPEDAGFMHINKGRVATIAQFVHKMNGGWPAILTNKTRRGLLNNGYLPSQIDGMSPLQAHARLYRLENDADVSGPLKDE